MESIYLAKPSVCLSFSTTGFHPYTFIPDLFSSCSNNSLVLMTTPKWSRWHRVAKERLAVMATLDFTCNEATLLKLIFGCRSFCLRPIYACTNKRIFIFFIFASHRFLDLRCGNGSHFHEDKSSVFSRFSRAESLKRKTESNVTKLDACFQLIQARKLRLQRTITGVRKVFSDFQLLGETYIPTCFYHFNLVVLHFRKSIKPTLCVFD